MKYLMLIISAVFTIWAVYLCVLDTKVFLASHNIISLVMAVIFALLAYWNCRSFVSRISPPKENS